MKSLLQSVFILALLFTIIVFLVKTDKKTEPRAWEANVTGQE